MDLCRTKGCISYEDNGLKLLFGPMPPSSKVAAKVDADPRASKREHYNLLLGRTNTEQELDQLPDV
jgi:hypothetical protein